MVAAVQTTMITMVQVPVLVKCRVFKPEDRYKFDCLWQVYMDKVYDSNQDSSDSALSPERSPAVSSARSSARSRSSTMSPVRPPGDKPDAEAELVDKQDAETSRRAE